MPTQASRLAVLIGGQHAGWLTQDPQTQFTYSPSYLDSQNPTPLSISMPLTGSTYRQSPVMPWVDGLLPDSDEVRRRWARQFGISAANPFLLLANMGVESPGAIQFCHSEDIAAVQAESGEYLAVDDSYIAARLDKLTQDSSNWTVSGERWSLGGAQSKFALAWTNGGWHEAHASKPTTHIFKPGAQGYPGHGLNEHLTLATASRLGLRAAKSTYQEFDGLGATIVARYDRTVSQSGRAIRLHQEDLCQALGVNRRKKYEEDGGPGAAAVTDLLREVGGSDDVWRFGESLIFNYLIGGSDAHAKNFSLLLSGSQVRLAPLYDLSSALLYEPRDANSGLHKLAMAIGGERRFGHVGEPNWRKLAARARLEPDRVLDRIQDLAAKLPDALSTVINETSASDAHTPARYLDRLVEHLREAGLQAGRLLATDEGYGSPRVDGGPKPSP